MALWGKRDVEGDKPKYIVKDANGGLGGATGLAATVGVNVTEAQVASNRAKGIKTPGWTRYTTYTDSNGHVRHKAEVLVAMGAGETVAVMGDAADDSVVADA
jgi:hypothetical protein